MEEMYKKINNGDVDIKYLSPNDLVNLEIYLEKINLNLSDLLIEVRNKNNELSLKKNNLEKEISNELI